MHSQFKATVPLLGVKIDLMRERESSQLSAVLKSMDHVAPLPVAVAIPFILVQIACQLHLGRPPNIESNLRILQLSHILLHRPARHYTAATDENRYV